MKQVYIIISVWVLVLGLLISCKRNVDFSKLNSKEQKDVLQELKKDLEGGQDRDRQQPFVEREFKPYLSAEWIGNAVSYGCYRKGQEPGKKGPSKEQIFEDLKIIADYWNLIRVYNADDDTEHILEVIKENGLPIKMMLGIWLANETDNPAQKEINIKNVLRGIQLANHYKEQVMAINVGNETQVFWSWHKMQTEDLVRYIRVVREHVTVPVTTADDYNFWNKAEARPVADELDFIATHIHPMWNGKTLDDFFPWLDSTFTDIKKRYPQRDIILGETGWATNYNRAKKGPGEQGTLIKGEVGLRAQEKYLIQHRTWVSKNNVITFLFEAFDEPWKGGGEASGPDEVEKHWGVFYENRTAKESFENYLLYLENSLN